MTDLPVQPQKASDTPQPIGGTVGIGKEGESIAFPTGEITMQDTGKEMELPKELTAVGVKTQPTVISVPPPVIQYGVRMTGSNIGATTITTPVLPLTETQIAESLHVSIVNSIRWLAEWCKRKLLQVKMIKKDK